MFTQQSSPDSGNDASFGMNSNFYGQNIGSMMGMGGGGPMSFDTNKNGSGPMLSTTSTDSGDGGQGAGEVFMGVQSPQPGGWKWTGMADGSGQQSQK
jgi:hypothetical protein